MQTFRVEQTGLLLDYLAAAIGNRTRAKQWLKLRQVLVNGETADRHDRQLSPGDVIRIGPPQRAPSGTIPGVEIVYEDDSILVVDKPAGLLTIATDAERTRTAYFKATEYVRQRSRPGDGRVFIVHRLDRETSGLLVFAKTEAAKHELQTGWEEVEKRYYAVVEGGPREKTGTIESELTETAAYGVFSGRKTKRSKHAVTHYTVLKEAETRSLLEIRTDTGRKHQIRVHLADLGHPIVGDARYGKGRAAGRLGLHASYLRFRHPATGEFVEFRSELPAALRRELSLPSKTSKRRGGTP
ncbi:MAG TPA: RluA family pseudouridine synthase [Planctomycetaceae bacterium]